MEVVHDVDFFAVLVEEIEVARVVCVLWVSYQDCLGVTAVDNHVVNRVFLTDGLILGVINPSPRGVIGAVANCLYGFFAHIKSP